VAGRAAAMRFAETYSNLCRKLQVLCVGPGS
jgi:hypothetical protein